MKTISTTQFNILLAEHSGMCFGVRQAITATEKLLAREPATILGELAHNPKVKSRLAQQGARSGELSGTTASTKKVVITAHGASDRDRVTWKEAGYQIMDTTCPLVRVAHRKLASLVAEGYFPVIIGKAGHIEVRGLMGDFPGAQVVLSAEDIRNIPNKKRIGIISQTTQPITKVRQLVEEIRTQRPESHVMFQDTVCQPTKDRQRALDELCRASDVVIAIGGKNSNNTKQLAGTARTHGCAAYHIEGAHELQQSWFQGVGVVGVTAGTSTLDECVDTVITRLKEVACALATEGEHQRSCWSDVSSKKATVQQ